MSGSSSYFDIIGTMWIVSLFVVLGLRGMWVQWIWGFVIPAFYAAYMGRWPRPSRVMTGSEWMVFRFGAGRSGDANRLAYTVYAVLTVTVFLALAPRLPRTRRMTIRTPMIIRPRKITQRPDHLGMVERTARYSASNHLAIDHSGAHRGSFGKTRRFQHNLMKSTKRSHLVDMSNNALREPEVGCFWGC